MAKNLIIGDTEQITVNGELFLDIDCKNVKVGDIFAISAGFRLNTNIVPLIVATGSISATLVDSNNNAISNTVVIYHEDLPSKEEELLTITKDSDTIKCKLENKSTSSCYYLMLTKGTDFPEWEQWKETKYTFKYVKPGAPSTNLIVGNTERISGNHLFNTSINNVSKGDKYCVSFYPSIACDSYFTLVDGSNNNISNRVYDYGKGIRVVILTIQQNYNRQIFFNIEYDRGDVGMLMLNKGETPLPWENNLGSNETTICEIKKFVKSKNLIIGDTKKIITYLGDNYYSTKISCKSGDNITISGNYDKIQEGLSISLFDIDNSKFICDGFMIKPAMDDTPFNHTFICHTGSSNVMLNIYSYDGMDILTNIMLNKGEDPLPWQNNITGNDDAEVSLSPIYKNDEKVWEKAEPEPYIIIYDSKYDPNAKVLIHPLFFNKHFRSDGYMDEEVHKLADDICEKWSAYDVLYVSTMNYIDCAGFNFAVHPACRYYSMWDFTPEYEKGYYKFYCHIDYD